MRSSTDEILPLKHSIFHISKFNMEINSHLSRVNTILRLTSMTPLSYQMYLIKIHSSHLATRLSNQITNRMTGEIMISINFINSVKTPFFNHNFGSRGRSFFTGLKDKSYSSVTRNFVQIIKNKRSGSQKSGCMSIVSTSVHVAILRSVF